MWKGFPCAAFGLLIVLQCALVPASAALGRAADVVWDGDKLVDGTESYRGTILLRGNLTVTGDLTLAAAELIVETPANGHYAITVEKGGSLTVQRGSRIHSWDPDLHYCFRVRPGGALTMDASIVSDCGWDDCDNWTLRPFDERGLCIESDKVTIANSTITGNNVGILVDGACAPTIRDNTITMNAVSGIEVYNGGSPVIDQNEISQNNYGDKGMWYYFVAGVASEGATPVITNNSIFSNIDTCGILISGGSGTVASGNEISAHIDSYGYGNYWGIQCFAEAATIRDNHVFRNDNGLVVYGGDNVIEGNLFENNKNEVGSIGIYDFSMSSYRNNTVDGSTYGVILGDGSSATFLNETVTNATDGVNGWSDMSQFNAVFTNCTFKANTRDVNIESPWSGSIGSGTVTLVNPDYSAAKARVVDDNGKLVVKWYVRARVVYESDGSGAPGADVKFKDARGAESETRTTDEDGWTGTFTLTEYRYDGRNKVELSPHELSAACGTRSNTTKVVIDRSRDASISLHDLPPLLVVDAPANGTLTNTTSIEVQGRTEPGAVVEIDGSSVEVSMEGGWMRELPLKKEGVNEFTVQAWDAMMNKARVVFVVFRDTETPVITLEYPAENALFNTSSVELSGSVSDPEASLSLNGAPVTVAPDGSFSVTVALEEGRNTFELSCRDAAGNTGTLVRHLSSDTIAPALHVETPADGSASNASTVVATGSVESGAELTINGVKYTSAGTGFQVTLDLSEGSNSFVFQARDKAGNLNRTTVTVLRDSTPPVLAVSGPSDGTRLNQRAVQVTGTTEPGAVVTVNGEGVENAGGTFNTTVTLVEGQNKITVRSRDALFNAVERSVEVFVDTVAPALELTGPANGTLTNQTTVIVTGQTEPGASVRIAGKDVSLDDKGRFSTEVALPGEGANVIEVRSSDAMGNTAMASVTVRRDTAVGFNISGPADGLKVKARNVTVSGKAEQGATVVIHGTVAPLAADGSFGLVVPLDYGANEIMVVINDTAGNSETVILTVTRERPPAQSGNPLPVEAGFLTVLAVLVALGAAGIYFGRGRR